MRLTTIVLRILTASLVLVGAPALAETVTKTDMGPPPFSDEEMEAARAVLDERYDACKADRHRSLRYQCDAIWAEVFLVEKPGGAIEWEAERRFWLWLPRAEWKLRWLYDNAEPAEKALILRILDENWSRIVRGQSAHRTGIVRRALEHDDRRVRNAAANLMATKPLVKIGHHAIDAATFHPELTPAALHAIAVTRTTRHGEWVVSQLETDDETVRDAALWTIWKLGPEPTLGALREALESESDTLRRNALEAILRFGSPSSVPWLYAWLEANPDADETLRDRVISVLAEVESGLFRPGPVVPPTYEPLPVDDAE
jgi:hypothetical protein